MPSDVLLRPLEPEDVTDAYLGWFADTEVTRHLEARNLTREDAVGFLMWGRETGLRHMYAICLAEDGRHIGNLKIGDIDRKSGVSDLVTVIGDRACWGRGLATQAIRQGSALAFERHGVRKLSGGIYADNIGSVRAYTRAGWLVEAVLHRHHMGPDGPVDRVVVSCFNPAAYPTLPSFPLPVDAYRE